MTFCTSPYCSGAEKTFDCRSLVDSSVYSSEHMWWCSLYLIHHCCILSPVGCPDEHSGICSPPPPFLPRMEIMFSWLLLLWNPQSFSVLFKCQSNCCRSTCSLCQDPVHNCHIPQLKNHLTIFCRQLDSELYLKAEVYKVFQALQKSKDMTLTRLPALSI